jgi:hypothetical protein
MAFWLKVFCFLVYFHLEGLGARWIFDHKLSRDDKVKFWDKFLVKPDGKLRRL